MRALLPCLLLPILALAAESRPAGISATFRALSFSAPLADAAYAVSEVERIPLLITSDFMTGEQRYRGPANLVFTHLAKDLTETPLGQVQLADQSRVILLFVPDGKGGQTIRSLRDVEGDFPWGTLRFINLTGGRVRAVSGNKMIEIPNGGDRTLRPAAAHRAYATTEILTEREDGFARGYLLRTFQEDDLRTLCFLLPGDPKEHAVMLKGVEERKGDDRTPPPPVTPVSIKPRDKPVNGQPPKGARR